MMKYRFATNKAFHVVKKTGVVPNPNLFTYR
ncbi:hypothetical protein ABID22_002470 [Pontibacter aydingkolensis]